MNVTTSLLGRKASFITDDWFPAGRYVRMTRTATVVGVSMSNHGWRFLCEDENGKPWDVYMENLTFMEKS